MERDLADWLKYENVINFNSHAHVERDGLFEICNRQNQDFNSHAHVERDTSAEMFSYFVNISTHTLTWSVT